MCCVCMRPCTRTLLFYEPSTWEALGGRNWSSMSAQLWPWGFGGHMNRCSEVCAPILQLPASQHTHKTPAVAWEFYLEQVSSTLRWLMLDSYHSAPWERQLFSPCHHTDRIAATLQFLPSQSASWQGLGPSAEALVAAEAGAQTPCMLLPVVVCYAYAAFEGAPTVCGMQRWAFWKRGPRKGRGGKGAGNLERKTRGGDLWTVPPGNYDSIFNWGSEIEKVYASSLKWALLTGPLSCGPFQGFVFAIRSEDQEMLSWEIKVYKAFSF